jgi:hypothetical protein
MSFKPVKSSNIHSVAYDPTARTLEVKFHSGGHFLYHDVDPKTHEGLMNADSAGSYFGKHVRNSHRSEDVNKPKK